MGLDIYIRWDNMTDDELDAQVTGFVDACEVGYLRYNWMGLGLVRDVARTLAIPVPVPLHDSWDGFNGDDVEINAETLELMLQERMQWLENIGKYDGESAEYFNRKLTNAAILVDFIKAKFDEGASGLRLIYG